MQVSNSAGSVTSVSAQLILLRAPAITSAPASAAVVAGASATYSLLASADALRYLWLRNGLPISGAMSGTTSSHTTAVLALADSGAIYSVIVFNGAGAVVSAGATLTVTAPPGLTATTLVSRSTSGAAPNTWSILPSLPSLSAEGQRAAFRSKGTNLLTGTLAPRQQQRRLDRPEPRHRLVARRQHGRLRGQHRRRGGGRHGGRNLGLCRSAALSGAVNEARPAARCANAEITGITR